ncbi:MAG: hypothetical protein HRU79_02355 [Ignavibacteria bacterium]|nr:MAG: hypothetical protein HRU79_02355 [Ignavibacteria bacterium]
MKKQALKLPRLILLSILALVSWTPISFKRTAKSALDTPRLTSSDLRSRLTLSFQLTIIDKFVFAILETNYHICKLFDKNKNTAPNITYTQAGVSCFVGQESAKFKVQFFVGNLVVKIPACV